MKLLSDIKISLNERESLSNRNIISYSCNDTTPSLRRNYILKNFNNIYKIYKSECFLLKEIAKNKIYRNDFFELNYDVLCYIGKDKYNLISQIEKIQNQEVFVPKSYRDFALIHNTHNSKEENNTDTSFVLIRESLSNYSSDNTKRFILNGRETTFDNKNKILIIVENYKIFELYSFDDYLNKFDIHIDNNFKYEVMYGSGNKVTSMKNIPFLNSYSKIEYMGDYDDEGFKIFNSLHSKVENSHYVLPKQNYINEIQKEMNLDSVIVARKNAKKENDCFINDIELLNILNLKKGLQMQQEVFL